jgi:hypothetical protein
MIINKHDQNQLEGGTIRLAINGETEMEDDIYKVGKDGTVNKSRREQRFKQDITK